MGVYIKGMEMPERCAVCWMMDGEDSWCCACRGRHLNSEFRYGIKDKPDWCPLVPVPPHGRLIDADALRKCGLLYREGMDVGGVVYVPIRDVFRSINTAPTIIPAEEGER